MSMEGARASAPNEPRVTVDFEVPVQMRDGVTLRANVYRPVGEGPWPTLLGRLPYGKAEPLTSFWLDPVQTARQGFVVVLQDTRGRFASEGEWVPFRHEGADGYDSVEWAARLPGSNGRVGMFGGSYWGNTQWMAAVEQPPSLGAIVPTVTWSDPLDGLFARGGALELGTAVPWTLLNAASEIARDGLPAAERDARLREIVEALERLPTDGYRHLPVHDMPLLRELGADIGTLSMLDNPEVTAWSRIAGRHEQVLAPCLNIAGWFDNCLQGSIDNHVAMAALGRTSRILVGPWTHFQHVDPVGELCFGPRSGRTGPPAHPEGDVVGVQLAWLRRHLGDGAAAERDAEQAPVRIFVMGRNEWRDEQEWPPARARVARWHLHAGGGLSPAAPATGAPPSAFAYDPGDPVPTLGGNLAILPAYTPGPFDQVRVEARPDVLVFTSEVLQHDMEVTGRIRVVLHARSSAPSTDWVARLCDVHPDGRSYNVCDGIRRVDRGADALAPVELDLWSTSNVFLAGHRLRVHVTSSSFPRWDRNLNTGDQRSARFETARQLVHHDADRPSWIELPVIDAPNGSAA